MKGRKGLCMKKSRYKSFDDLPLMLTVPDVSNVLGIGLAHAYEIVRRRDFPTITLGSRIIVPRDKFMMWIDTQADKKDERF
jgi:predicted DNA-binding transcriptional regulator AlpA